MSLSLRDLAQARGSGGEAASVDDLRSDRGDLERPVGLRELFGALPEEAPALLPASWQNWLGDHHVACFRARPDSRAEVVGALQEAVRRDVRVRAVGSGHSHSNAARPSEDLRDIWVDLSNCDGKLSHRGWLRSSIDKDRLVRFRAGTTIKQINREILPGRDLALPNMGSFDGQTLAGAINTGTHGTGINLATFADFVRSLEIVTVFESSTGRAFVQPLRIEPSEGITDPDTFNGAFDQHGMILIQDDDLFRSVTVGYGCVGIATAYTLELRDAYWLHEDSELSDLESVLALLEGPSIRVEGSNQSIPEFLLDHRHVQILVNVAELYEDPPRENLTCLIKRHSETDAEEEPFVWLRRWPPERRKTVVRDMVRHFLSSPSPDDDRPKLGKNLRNHYFEPEANQEPFVQNRESTASYIALKRMRDVGDADEPPTPPDRALSTEFSVPINQTALTLRRLVELLRDSDSLIVPPTGIRFTAPSRHHLAASQGRYTAMLEVAVLVETRRAEEVERRMELAKDELRRIERALLADETIRSRPHLGKFTRMNREQLEAAFPRFQPWRAAYRRFNPLGLFDNDFTRQFDLGS